MKYDFPASFKKARLHKKAVKFGYNAPVVDQSGQPSGISPTTHDSSKKAYQKPKVCACCYQPINTRNIDISYNTTDP